MAQPPYLRLPPFPAPPDGVEIVPFKEFREAGIQMFTSPVNDEEDEVEIDGRGIPTIALRVKHDTDQCKSNAKRKRGKKKKNNDENHDNTRSMTRHDWWELWEDAEHLRVFNYDPNLSRADRIFQAAHDFKTHRTWPPAPFGIHAIWDQFRLFVGLLSNTPVWRKSAGDKAALAADDEDDAFSDEEVIPIVNDLPPKAQPYPESGALLELEEEDEIEQKEEKLDKFLNDPECMIKIFLSSFMRRQGLIWSDRNLVATPKLILSFLRFLQRNRVFPEPTHVRALRNALAIVDLAAKELPLTAKIARAIPDTFHQACLGCWGERAEGYKTLGTKVIVEDKPKDALVENHEEERDSKKIADGDAIKVDSPSLDFGPLAALQAVNVQIQTPDDIVENNEEERDPKRRKISDRDAIVVDSPGLGLGTSAAGTEVKAALKAANVQILTPDDIVMETLGGDVGVEEVVPNTEGGAWVGGDGWGTDGDAGEWEADAEARAACDFTSGPVDPFAWEPIYIPMTIFLGPTVLPLTHETGVVELSVRRIKQVRAAGTVAGGKKGERGSWEPDPEGVEAELENMFAKVVLEPWAGWSDEEVNMAKPKILESSRGAVVGADGIVLGETGSARPHDPVKDDIIVLVEPSVVETLSIGMGLGATWVQIVRQDQVRDGDDGTGKKGKKGKKGKVAEKYWYVEEVTMILPSYYM